MNERRNEEIKVTTQDKQYIKSTVELHLCGLIRKASHPDLQKIRIIGFFFENRLLEVHGSVHRNIKLIERTNKMQPCSRIYYSIVS
jgi:hypothetical protein